MSISKNTEVLYQGRNPKGENFGNPAAMPLFANAAFTMRNVEEVHHAYAEKFTYVRTNNPNREALAEAISTYEGSERTLIFSSGIAAISSTMIALLNSGDHIICNTSIYGETCTVFNEIVPKLNVNVEFVDLRDLEAVKKAMRPNTKMIYTEVCSNPSLTMADIPALAEIAHSGNAYLMVDNTFTTPVSIQPISKGADIVINSLTKFMNGHSNAICGSISACEEIIEVIEHLRKYLGTSGDPFDSWLVFNNLQTAHLRIKTHTSNAAKLAAALEKNPHVIKVNHPSLESFPQHDLATKLFNSNEEMTGILSFEMPNDQKKIDLFMRKLKFVHYMPSLGGVHTTLMHPYTHFGTAVSEEALKGMGITPGLMRVSVGIEDINDLIEEFNQALTVFD